MITNTNPDPMERMSRQKKMILQEVRGSLTHPTADEVYERLRKHLPRISLGTVYRNLDRLSRDGLIRTIEGAGSRRYDGDLEEHWHIRCEGCGRISDVRPEANLYREEGAALPDGFKVTGWHVEYRGVCGECRNKQGEVRGAKGGES